MGLQGEDMAKQEKEDIHTTTYTPLPKESSYRSIDISPNKTLPMNHLSNSTGFQTFCDEEEELVNDEDMFLTGGGSAQKKRRLSVDQVKALEKNFEVENKLEPERKVRLAQELALQPRQVAVWFQNRRARWKTKQLERDYTSLKSRYDALRVDYDSILRDKDSLIAEVKELKAKLNEDEEEEEEQEMEEKEAVTLIYNNNNKDGSSDSDSSAVVNDGNTPPAVTGSGAGLLYQQQQLMKVEDGFLDGDEPCSFFNDEQPPTLSWYCGGEWE